MTTFYAIAKYKIKQQRGLTCSRVTLRTLPLSAPFEGNFFFRSGLFDDQARRVLNLTLKTQQSQAQKNMFHILKTKVDVTFTVKTMKKSGFFLTRDSRSKNLVANKAWTELLKSVLSYRLYPFWGVLLVKLSQKYIVPVPRIQFIMDAFPPNEKNQRAQIPHRRWAPLPNHWKGTPPLGRRLQPPLWTC